MEKCRPSISIILVTRMIILIFFSWRDVLGLEKLKEICDVMEGGCWAFAHSETDRGGGSAGVRLNANVVKRTTLSSLQEKGRARGGVVPVERIIPEECMRKKEGCGAPRKRVWADLQFSSG